MLKTGYFWDLYLRNGGLKQRDSSYRIFRLAISTNPTINVGPEPRCVEYLKTTPLRVFSLTPSLFAILPQLFNISSLEEAILSY